MSSIRLIGTGHVVPPRVVKNEEFVNQDFYDDQGNRFEMDGKVLIEKFEGITGIAERRYTVPEKKASDLGTEAALLAIADAGIQAEEIDLIIVAHNFGDVDYGNGRTDVLPSLASRIKHNLGIRNPLCVPYDILFGCPGWVQGVIQAELYIRAKKASKVLVVGCETLSRTLDLHDRDSMIFADGAGACIVSEVPGDGGILGSAVMNLAVEEAYYLYEGCSYKPGQDQNERFIKMKGRKIYEFALRHVPAAMKAALDNAGVDASQIDKIFMHQANAKLDHAVMERFFKLTGIERNVDDVMPMSVHWLGNSSVATVPTLYDLVRKTQYSGHGLKNGDLILFASVGAGMNVNAVVYIYQEEI